MADYSPRGYKNPSTEAEALDPVFWASVGLNQDSRWLELDKANDNAIANIAIVDGEMVATRNDGTTINVGPVGGGGGGDTWSKGVSNTDMNLLREAGVYQITSASTPTNLPVGIVGVIEVLPQGVNTLQRYTTLENAVRIYTRVYRNSSGLWSDWYWMNAPSVGILNHGNSGTADLNTLTTPGFYHPASTAPNMPVQSLGSLLVEQVTSRAVQTFKSWGLPVQVFVRRWSGATWGEWVRQANADDITPLSDRIDTLENQAGSSNFSTRLVSQGDSITEARGQTDPYVQILGAALGVSWVNNGWHGASTQNIGMRQGGNPTLVRFADNTIPADTATVDTTQAVSFENPAFPLRAGNTVETVPGMIMGIHGALSYDGRAGIVMWARDTAGEAITVQGDVRFYPDQGETYRNDIQLIWTGHNNAGQYTDEQITDIVGEMIDHTAHPLGKFLVLQNLAGEGWSDPTNRNWLAYQRWPGNYVPVADYLRSQACADFLGHTLTAQDLSDIAAGWTPSAYRTDTLHLNSMGRQGVAERVRQFMVAKGWS